MYRTYFAACSAAPVLALAAAATRLPAQEGSQLEKCERPIGAIAIVEPQDHVIQALARYNLQSPTTLIRMMVQQSGCFVVVERGIAMQNLQQERALAESGELRQGSNVGKGQLRTADYVLTPTVLFSEGNAGGAGGALAGFGGRLGALSAVGGALKFKEAETTILIADARSSVQVAAAQGKARKTDFRLGMLGWAGGVAGALGGYTNTNEGKVIAASFLDNYNRIVVGVRADPTLRRVATGDASAMGGGVQAGAVYAEGDVLSPKIGGVKLHAEPSANARALATLGKGDEVVFLGNERDGFLLVQGAGAEGWVRKTLVNKR